MHARSSANPATTTLAEMIATRCRENVIRALETAVKRMEDAAQDARRELRHLENADLSELTRLVGRIITMGAWSHANITSDLTCAIKDLAEQHHVAGTLEAAAEREGGK